MAKKIKKLVVDAVYFGLIERKAQLLDEMSDLANYDGIAVTDRSLKDLRRIQVEWNKKDASLAEGTESVYQEPKEPKK